MLQKSKKLLALGGNLIIRNSESLQIVLQNIQSQQFPSSIVIPASSNIKDLKDKLGELKLTGVDLRCVHNLLLSNSTPIEALLNRQFYIISNEYSEVTVIGQLDESVQQVLQQQEYEGFQNLTIPVIKKKQIQNYIKRVSKLLSLKHQKKDSKNIKISAREASEALIEAALDPVPQQRQIYSIQEKWDEIALRHLQMKQQKTALENICFRRVKMRMALGLGAILTNIAFVWSGTYFFYSWDIIQPMAYFVDSTAAIVLAYQFFKIKRKYSHYNYNKYLFQKIIPKVYKQHNFSIQQFQKSEKQLKILQSSLKDHYIKNL